MIQNTQGVGAIVLAAGASRRMGQPKMVLPYRDTTVLGAVLRTLRGAGADPLVVVIGGAREQVETILEGLPFPVIRAYNPEFEHNEMLDSLRIGMAQLPGNLSAFLVALGDQPQIQEAVVENILKEFAMTGRDLIIPSFQMRRGHPWLIGRALWSDLQQLETGQTMRDFLQTRHKRIQYLNVDTPSILQDLDTPEDYQNAIANE